MIKLNKEIQTYIQVNLHADLHSLLLKKSPFPDVTIQEIVQQIKGRKVAEKKFPFLLKEGIVFSSNLNLEQASSEATAIYKSNLVQGKTFIDLTCGFGIDAYFLSKNFEETTLVEQNAELLEIVEHNWKFLDKKANFINDNLNDFLQKNTKKFDVLYLDPARRDEKKNKVFLLEDLSPNLLEIQAQMMKISDKILIKLSPLIDISYLISVLKNIAEIHIVAVKNEVKEILVLINSTNNSERIKMNCVNLESGEKEIQLYFDEIETAKSEFSEPLKYLYIPNNAILKAGIFNVISEKFGLKKLHPNTHLYTSNELIVDFSGRILEVKTIDSKEIKKGVHFNIISKNHPLKPDEIKKKYKILDGGNQYLIFTKSLLGNVILQSI